MNCTACTSKSCRSGISCGLEDHTQDEILSEYAMSETQATVQAAAHLVDGGRAGQLSRIEELAEFIKEKNYIRAGLAYCYGMEGEALKIVEFFKHKGIAISAVSCTIGALPQNKVNSESTLCGVSCNPLGQAAKLINDGVDIAIQFALCLGHDMIFTRSFPGDQTVLAVKDRVFGTGKVL